MRRWGLPAALLVLVLVGAAASDAQGSTSRRISSTATSGYVHVCVAQQNHYVTGAHGNRVVVTRKGTARVVGSNLACEADETYQTWATGGPTGPEGPQGAQGEVGPRGVVGPQGPVGPAGGGTVFTVACTDCLSDTAATKGFLPLNGWLGELAPTSEDVDSVVAAPGSICWVYDVEHGTLPMGSSVAVELWRNDKLWSAIGSTYGTGQGNVFGGGAGGMCDSFITDRGDVLATRIVYSGPAPSSPVDLTISILYVN